MNVANVLSKWRSDGLQPDADLPTLLVRVSSTVSGDPLVWLAQQLGWNSAGMADTTAWQPRFDKLPFVDCSRLQASVVVDNEGDFLLLSTNPFDVDRLAWARTHLGHFKPILVAQDVFNAWLATCERQLSAMGLAELPSQSESSTASAVAEELSLIQIGQGQSPAVRFVNSTLFDALRAGASDIHLECTPAGLAVKFRIDGVLCLQRHVDGTELSMQAISRIKVMSMLDISERRVPQDGRLQIVYEGRSIDVRVSIMPSIHGEDAVLRVLDRQHLAQTLDGLTLAKLGFDSVATHAISAWGRRSHGMLLVTGPTGSGKTTTLYAVINQTMNARDKVITIEDPVEYQLPGVLQIPVNERKGLSFAKGLRSILRHDPDKILVGEIRDTETAQIAIQSALTGHLVFTTVHANTAFDVVGRFNQLGIDAYTFAAAVNGIVAQRLLRKVCQHCCVPASAVDDLPTADESQTVLLQKTPQWVRAVGCERCRGSGYAGRFALGEILEMTPAMKSLIAIRAPLTEIQALAEQQGWRSLRALALSHAAAGLTTIEEVNRVAS